LKRILKSVFIIAIVAIAMIGVMVPSVFAESPVLIQTDKKEYSMGEDIILQGIVKFVNGKAVGIGLPENLNVAIEVYNSKNQLITSHVADVKNDNTFLLKIKTGKNSSILINDQYFFVVYYGIATNQLLNSDFVGRYDVYVGVSALNSNTLPSSIINNPTSGNIKPNPVIPYSGTSPELNPEHFLLIGIGVAVGFLAIIIKKILGGRTKLPKDLEKTLNQNFKNISGDEFEELIAELYRKKGYTVKKTPKGPDQGVDLFLTKKRWAGQNRIIVQAKNWTGHVGNGDVLKTAGARQMFNASSAIIIISSHFSPSALKALSNTPHISGIEVDELKREFRKYFKIPTKKRKNKKSNTSQRSTTSTSPPPSPSGNTETSTMFFYECPKCHSGDIENNPDGSVNCPDCGYRG
jgi:restriction system protein